jgi:hypothetical protein
MKKYPHKFRQRGIAAEKFIDHKSKCDPNCLGYVEIMGKIIGIKNDKWQCQIINGGVE